MTKSDRIVVGTIVALGAGALTYWYMESDEKSQDKDCKLTKDSESTKDENKCKCPDVSSFDMFVKLTKNIKAIRIDFEWNAKYHQTLDIIEGDAHMIFGVPIGKLGGHNTAFMVIDEDLLPTQKTKQDFQKFLDANPILKDLHPKVMMIEDQEK